MRKHAFYLSVLILAVSQACVDEPSISDVPRVDFLSLSKDTMDQGINFGDSIFVSFSFEDGDGDLGDMDGSNIFFIDLREEDEFISHRFRIPELPNGQNDRAVQGEITVKLLTTCCKNDLLDPCEPSEEKPYDMVQYDIYIQDLAGNQSNRTRTSPIILRCN